VTTVAVSSTVVTMSVVSIVVIVGSDNEWGQSLFVFHLASRNDPHTIVSVTRLDVNGTTVSVAVTILVDDGIGVFSVITDNVDLGRVSFVVVAAVTIDNNSVAVSTVGDDGGVIMPVSTSLDDGGLIVPVTSGV
jgi:hypothetical protein